jgi:hypothetical protein
LNLTYHDPKNQANTAQIHSNSAIDQFCKALIEWLSAFSLDIHQAPTSTTLLQRNSAYKFTPESFWDGLFTTRQWNYLSGGCEEWGK